MYIYRKYSFYSQHKLVNPSAERNKNPILDILKNYLSTEKPEFLLEISSGTGQHTAYFAPNFPNLTFQPSEYDKTMLPHIQTYIDSCATKNIQSPLHIDIRTPIESWGLDIKQFDYMLNINMIHISPFPCTEGLFRSAGVLLKPGGLLITYGPFANNGILEPESNVRFDKMLRSQNSEWGVRDIVLLKELAEVNGLELCQKHDMPANNKCLIWKKL